MKHCKGTKPSHWPSKLPCDTRLVGMPRTPGGYVSASASEKKALQARLAKAEGQLRAISRMVEQDCPPVDTLVQITAIQGALGKIGELILTDHIESCVSDLMKNSDEGERERSIHNLMGVFSRYGAR